METAEQILKKIIPNFEYTIQFNNKSEVLKAMKAYAQQECEKVRRDCADNLKQAVGTFNSDYSSQKKQILSTPITLS